ncbi:MAG: VanZ family protein [Clostridia bacterium]|nr:VanZ family protein [Clostridia bacterium]
MKKAPISKWIFLIYLLLMVWLLLGERLLAPFPSGGQNLIPFSTIASQLALLKRGRYYLRFAMVNLAGNLLMFLPLGYLLPRTFPRFRKFLSFFPLVVLSLLLVEGIQYITMLGIADVDDVILNLFGALMGFGLFKFTSRQPAT